MQQHHNRALESNASGSGAFQPLSLLVENQKKEECSDSDSDEGNKLEFQLNPEDLWLIKVLKIRNLVN